MQSEFVNLMWMMSARETHVLSVNVPREVKGGLITKLNVFQSVRVLLQVITLSAFLGTQFSETGTHGSCTDACVNLFEVCAMLLKAIPHFLPLTVAQTFVLEMRPHWHEWFQQCWAREHVACSRFFQPVTFPFARNCSTNVFTVFPAGASLHLYWFLNRRWNMKIEFVCKNHSTIRVFCSVVSGGAILNDVTAASVAKYGKNTNV
jgi:hypothetical protein